MILYGMNLMKLIKLEVIKNIKAPNFNVIMVLGNF